MRWVPGRSPCCCATPGATPSASSTTCATSWTGGSTASSSPAAARTPARVPVGEWSEAWGRRAADAILRTAPDTDAVFCGNDQIARGVADALRERGVDVPGQIAVVGYDNWDTMALACRPPLTTIDMDL